MTTANWGIEQPYVSLLLSIFFNLSFLASTTPVRVDAVDNMRTVDIAAGYSHSVLLTRDGRVFVFGSDQFGQVGFGRK